MFDSTGLAIQDVATAHVAYEHASDRLHAFVIMSNHVHLLASGQSGSNLTQAIRSLKRHTAK